MDYGDVNVWGNGSASWMSNNTPPLQPTNPWAIDSTNAYSSVYESRRYLGCGIVPKFVYQAGENWYTNKGSRPPEMSLNLAVCWVRIIDPDLSGSCKAVEVLYTTDGKQFTTVIPYPDYRRRKLLMFFGAIRKYPGISEALVQDIIFYMLQNCPNVGYLLPQKGGWNRQNTLPPFLHRQKVLIPPSRSFIRLAFLNAH